MYDKEIIERICNLTCEKEDLIGSQTDIKYDKERPFKKYYNVDTIVKAFEKYHNKQWDDDALSYWCCKYLWVLEGGYQRGANDDLNPFEYFFKEAICWELDALAFFDEEYYDDVDGALNADFFIDMDHIWQTRDGWRGIYAPIGKYDEYNKSQYVLLFNDKLKEYSIIYSSSFLKNNYNNQNEYLKYISATKFINKVEELKNSNYKLISCSEEEYYDDLNDED